MFQKVSYNESIVGNPSKHRTCIKSFRSEHEMPILNSSSLALALFLLGKSVIYVKKTVHSRDTVPFPRAY